MTDDFQRLLDTDALIEAEKITGKHYKEDPLTQSLGFAMHIALGEKKRDELALRDDTHYGTSWFDTMRIYSDLGFSIVHQHRFTSSRDDTLEDTFIVLWRPDGVLATVESYGPDTNNSKLYYNWRPGDDVENIHRLTSSGGYHHESFDAGDKVWVGNHDGREALRHILARLEANGSFLNLWIERPFLWLLDYSQSKVPGYDYKAINETVLDALPEHVRTAITPGGTA